MIDKSTKSQTVSLEETDEMIIHQAQNNLIDFAIATDDNYQDTWFHETLANILQDAMEKVEQGIDVRIIVTIPPRHGKTEIATKKFPAWVLGHHPDWPIIAASYSGDLAVKFGEATRSIVSTEQYQEIFKTRLKQDSKAKGFWQTTEGGSYSSAGAGGAITGTGLKIGIIDDIFKDRKEAESKTIRDARWDWYRSTFYTRQEGATAIILLNTRWHTDDLVGRLMAEQKKNEENGEENYDKLVARIRELGMPEKELWWYLDTRKFGTVTHSGFGLGFERLLLFVTGMANIRDVIPFPRTPRNAEF
jgi:hypothetical protein